MTCDVGELTEKLESRAHSPTLPLLFVTHSSFCNPSVALPTSQFILQPFFRISYVTGSAHSPILPSFHLRHRSFSNPSVALPMSQLILQPVRCFTYVTVHSPTLLSFLLRHKPSLNSPGESPMRCKLLHLSAIKNSTRIRIKYSPGRIIFFQYCLDLIQRPSL